MKKQFEEPIWTKYCFPLKNEFWIKGLFFFLSEKKVYSGKLLSMCGTACEHLGISLLGCLIFL